MKRLALVLALALLLVGCGGNHVELEQAMQLRAELLGGLGCSFDAVITADYGDKIHTFSVACQSDEQGDLTFQVCEPDSIAGISGIISGDGGKLTFDDTALAFELLADDQVSPVSAPWLLVKTLRGGYVTSCGKDGEQIRVSIDDSYEEDALHMDIWLGENNSPVYAEILWKERRIISMELEKFEIL